MTPVACPQESATARARLNHAVGGETRHRNRRVEPASCQASPNRGPSDGRHARGPPACVLASIARHTRGMEER